MLLLLIMICGLIIVHHKSNLYALVVEYCVLVTEWAVPPGGQEWVVPPGEQEWVVPPGRQLPSHPSRYACHICSKCFSHSLGLRYHMNAHTGQKPYRCEVCLKCFTQKGNLKKHERIHTGEKPFKCKLCGTAFNQSTHLKRHHIINHFTQKTV